MRRTAVWAASFMFLVLAPAALVRAGDKLAVQARRLFELADLPVPKSLFEVEAHYQALPAAVRDDPRMRYAYSLVLIRQKRLLEAEPLLEQTAASRPLEWSIWQARIWVSLSLGKRAEALDQLTKLDRSMLAGAASGREAPAQEAAVFAGKISGFLAGPSSARFRAAELQKSRDQLRGVFEGDELTAFDQAEQEVVAQYDRLRGRHENLGRQALEDDRKRLDKTRSQLQQAGDSLQQQRQELQKKDARRNEELLAKLGEIEGELDKLQIEFETLMGQIIPLELMRETLAAQLLPIAPGNALAAAPPYDAVRANSMNRAAFARNSQILRMMSPIVVRMTQLQGEMAEVQDHVRELTQTRDALLSRRGQDAAKIATKKQELQRKQVKLDRTSKRLKAAPTANSLQVRTDAVRLGLLSTYLEFPFEEEKQHVLKALEKK